LFSSAYGGRLFAGIRNTRIFEIVSAVGAADHAEVLGGRKGR
jgi:hypothetical protein